MKLLATHLTIETIAIFLHLKIAFMLNSIFVSLMTIKSCHMAAAVVAAAEQSNIGRKFGPPLPTTAPDPPPSQPLPLGITIIITSVSFVVNKHRQDVL